MIGKLGRLQRVHLREVWQHEAIDFTPWLAKEENLALLGETLALELELEGQEENVGPFKADILCKDTLTGHYVLIENQLERTDHGHLGQLITYAAGLEAVTIVWIADHFTDEHRASLDWLNEISDDSAYFFGLEVELWRIGDSAIAPKFNIVSKPNEWTKTISQIARRVESGGLTDAQAFNLNFWTGFQKFLQDREGPIKPQKPAPINWSDFALGRAGFTNRAFISTMYDRLGIGLVIRHEDAKKYFALIEEQKEAIESEIGESLEWSPLPNKKRSQILLLRFNFGLEDENNWPGIYDWIAKYLEIFDRVFRPLVKDLNADDFELEED